MREHKFIVIFKWSKKLTFVKLSSVGKDFLIKLEIQATEISIERINRRREEKGEVIVWVLNVWCNSCVGDRKRKRRMKAAIQSHLIPIESTLCYLHLQYTVMMRMWFNGIELNNFGWRVGSQTQFHPIAKGKGSSLQTHHFFSPLLLFKQAKFTYYTILSSLSISPTKVNEVIWKTARPAIERIKTKFSQLGREFETHLNKFQL